MNAPSCPNCREKMSSVERGLGGVWSCLYCEGVWLQASQIQSIATCSEPAPLQVKGTSERIEPTPAEQECLCPGCGVSLQGALLGLTESLSCIRCHGAFFKKGAVQAHAPHLLSAAQEAPIAQAMAGVFGMAALLGDPLPLIVALSRRGTTREGAL